MSVWPSSVTRLGTAKEIYAASTVLFKKAYGTVVYPHLDPDVTATGWDRYTSWEEVAEALYWDVPTEAEGAMLLDDLEPITRVKLGSEAYFDIVRAVMKGDLKFKNACDHERVEEYASAITRLIAPSTQVTPPMFIEQSAKLDAATYKASTRFYDAADELKLLKRSRAWDDQDDFYVDATNNRVSDTSLYVYRRIGRVHAFFGKGPFLNKVIVLSDKGMDMVIGALERISAALEYIARAYAGDAAFLMKAVNLITVQVERAATVRGSSADKVAKAWHEVRTYVQYSVLKSIMSDASVAVREEYITDGFAQIISLDEAVSAVTTNSILETLELVHMYKWIPPPEYDITACLPEIRDLHMKPRISGANIMATEDLMIGYGRIKAERKMNLLAAYYKAVRRYPENLVKAGDHPTIDEASTWDHRGAYRYERLGKHVSSQIKDKTTVKASMAEEIRGNGGAYDQNFLTWYLLNYDTIDTVKELDKFAAGNSEEEAYSRVAYKGESQKVRSRPFFIAPPIRRLLLGEFEGNLSKIAKTYPAALIGKGDAATAGMMDKVMDPYATNPTIPSHLATTTYIVMFDVSKWSPKSDGAQVAEYHKFWAEVFGVPEIESLSAIGCRDTILNTTDGVVFSYKNGGADLEGFRGRMSTMYHADMLGASCREAIKRGYIAGKSDLVVFIDDGAVKIEAVGSGATAKENALNFLEVMKEIYAAGGQEIHNRKVVISEKGGEILANFYVNAVKVPQGIKAAMKMTTDYGNPIGSLVESNDAMFASAQGALKSGAKPLAIYRQYIVSIIRNAARFHRRILSEMNSTTFAIMAIAPKSFGGLGIQSLQGFTTTCVTNATAEGVSMLNRISRMYPPMARFITKIISLPVVKRSPLSILRDPLRVALAAPHLVESRLTRYVLEVLVGREPLLARLVSGSTAEDLKAHATSVAEALTKSGSISVPLIQRAWSATPLAQVEATIAKFERADSIIRFIGYRAVGSIRKANVSDVKAISAFYVTLLGNI